MINELNTLEGKIVRLASLCRNLRVENNLLRQQLADTEAEKRGLAERVETARERIERLAQRLPEAGTP